MRAILALFALALTACGVSDPLPGPANLTPGVGAGPTPAACGETTRLSYAPATGLARDYELHVPCGISAQKSVPLVVFLHGCNQTAQDAIKGTLWNELADEQGFIVAWPEQSVFDNATLDGNGSRCWNWFLPMHLDRDAGEPAAIAGITREVIAAHNVDVSRVYLMGISAGGEMSSTMGATYPDLYAAIAVFAGGPYLATDPTGYQAAQVMGEHARRLPVIVFHGTVDQVAAFPLGVAATRQWLGTNDWVDDGLYNNSVSQQPASRENHGLDAGFLGGLGSPGEICVGTPTSLPCAAGVVGADSYPYTIEHYLDGAGESLLDFWIIHGLGHNYVGGSREGNFSDPHGPDVTRAAYDFFLAHPKPADLP